MVYQKIQVRFGDVLLPPWFVDEEKSFFYELYCVIDDELRTKTIDPHTRYSINAINRGGEVVIKVEDDKSFMTMFSYNSNAEDMIILDVTPIISKPLQVSYPPENEEVDLDEEVDEDIDEEDEEDIEDEGEESEVDSLDPEQKDGQDYSSDDVSSDSVGDILTTTDDEDRASNDDDEVTLSGEQYNETFRRPRRYGDERHPNSNIPSVPNPVNDGGRIILRQWQAFDDFRCSMLS